MEALKDFSFLSMIINQLKLVYVDLMHVATVNKYICI